MNRLKLIWAALTWPKHKFFNLIQLTYAGEQDPNTNLYEDTGVQTTRSPGMVLVSFTLDPEGQEYLCHRPFYFLNETRQKVL